MASASKIPQQGTQKETYASTTARILSDPGLPNEDPSESYWQLPPHPLSHVKSATLPTETDILIIGSGITGCSVSHSLLRDASFTGKITLLEARTLCSGATGRNGGHIATHPVMDYSELLAQGVEPAEARKICLFQLGHFDMLLRDLEEVDRECGVGGEGRGGGESLVEKNEIRRVVSYCGFSGEEKVGEVRSAYERLEREVPELKGRARFFSGKEECASLQMPGVNAIITEPAGACWPYRLVTSLFAHLLTTHPSRFQIETQTPVLSVSSSASNPHSRGYRYTATTPRGRIHAQKIIYCINAHTTHLLPSLRGKIYPVQGHMTVQIPGPEFPSSSPSSPTKSWSITYSRLGLDYLTQSPLTGELFSGGGLITRPLPALGNPNDSPPSSSPPVLHHLTHSLPHWFGAANRTSSDGTPRVKSSWTGSMGFTGDHLPVVGRARGGEEWLAAGFNGYGMVNAWGCGQALVSLLLHDALPESFPQSYVLTRERLEKMRAETVVEDLLGPEERGVEV